MRLATLLVTAVCASAAHAADLLVVDGTGQTPGAFPDFASAIAAAAEGDVIEALTVGTPILVDGKGLTILVTATGTSFAPVEVRNLAAHQTVVLRGLRMQDPNLGAGGGPATVDLHDNSGTIVLEDVAMTAQFLTGGILPMLRIANCATVVLADCTVTGASGQEDPVVPVPYPVGTALSTSASAVYVHGGSITGGMGQDTFLKKYPGGPGALLVSGTLVLAGAQVKGGDGPDGSTLFRQCQSPGAGGHGILANGTLRLLGSTVAGGAAGEPFSGLSCPGSPDGQPIVQFGGSVTTTTTPLRHLTIDAPLVAGEAAQLTATGEPGDLFIVLVSLTTAPQWLPSLEGLLLGPLPAPTFLLGTIPATGTLPRMFATPTSTLPTGEEALPFSLQALVLDATAKAHLSSPTTSALRADFASRPR